MEPMFAKPFTKIVPIAYLFTNICVSKLFFFSFFISFTATDKIKSFAVGQEGSPDILAARVVAAKVRFFYKIN